MFYYCEGEALPLGGVGFLVHKTLNSNFVKASNDDRGAYLVFKVTEKYSQKVVRYMLRPRHTDYDYDDNMKAIHGTTLAFYKAVIENFNAKVQTFLFRGRVLFIYRLLIYYKFVQYK